jgi:hypothetical protein
VGLELEVLAAAIAAGRMFLRPAISTVPCYQQALRASVVPAEERVRCQSSKGCSTLATGMLSSADKHVQTFGKPQKACFV